VAAPASSFTAVVAALLANAFVTLIKFGAFAVSGSGAMLSEAIHSGADAANQFLLFVGLRRGARDADDEFQYGYGGERFVFGLLSAAGIFFVGCGVTTWHGIHGLVHPEMPELGPITWIVLAASLVIESTSMAIALRAVARDAGERGLITHLFQGADPAALAIVAEDGAAVLGLLLATTGIVLAYATGDARFDAMGSLFVGAILGAVAIFLVFENRELLLGKAVPRDVRVRFEELLAASPAVRAVRSVRTRQLTPEAFHLEANVTLDTRHLAARLDAVLPHDPGVGDAERERLLATLAAAALDAVESEIVALERAVHLAIPQARHVDLEVEPFSSPAAAPRTGSPGPARSRP
jgi:zinc transporter 9